jgi:hypothetical protein
MFIFFEWVIERNVPQIFFMEQNIPQNVLLAQRDGCQPVICVLKSNAQIFAASRKQCIKLDTKEAFVSIKSSAKRGRQPKDFC